MSGAVLIVVRHGRTEANASGLLLGRRLDPALDDLGRRQAAALGRRAARRARVVSSPLRRTRETAEAFGRPVEVDERWIELDYGELDGTPLRDVPARRVGGVAGRPVVGAARRRVARRPRRRGCGPRATRSPRRPPSATSSSSPTCRR